MRRFGPPRRPFPRLKDANVRRFWKILEGPSQSPSWQHEAKRIHGGISFFNKQSFGARNCSREESTSPGIDASYTRKLLILLQNDEIIQEKKRCKHCQSSIFQGDFGRQGSSNAGHPLKYASSLLHFLSYSSDARRLPSAQSAVPELHDQSQRVVVTALWCNFLVFSLKCGVWFMTTSHVMLAEAVHSLADLMNQALLAYGLISSRRAPDALHPYGYSRERFVWSLISAVGIFCLGSGATIVHGISNLWNAQLPENILIAALVIAGSMIMEGISLVVAVNAVRKGAAAERMTLQDYVWRGHDPTAVAVMMEDSAAVTGLLIAALSLIAITITGNPVYDSIGSILVGNLLGMVAVFLIQRNRHALIGRAMDDNDMKRVLDFLSSDPVVDAIYDCKSEVIGPGSYRFKAEIGVFAAAFNGVAIVQNYLRRTGRETWIKEFRKAVKHSSECAIDQVMAIYGEEVVAALGSEVDRLEKGIQRIVPGIRHVDIETHNPKDPMYWEKSAS